MSASSPSLRRALVVLAAAGLVASAVPLAVAIDSVGGHHRVAEALTNVARYAHASHARVRVSPNGERLVVEVADDGIGGADPGSGSGLRGLTDRLAALDGQLEVSSPNGSGTTVRAVIPFG